MLLIILVSIILSIPHIYKEQTAKDHTFFLNYDNRMFLIYWWLQLECFALWLCVHQQINVVFMVIALATVFKTKYRSVARRRKTKDLDSGDSPNLDLFKYAMDYVIIYVGQALWPVPLSCTFLGHCLLLLWSCFQCWEWLGCWECLQSTPTQLCLPGSSQSSTHFKYA